MSVNFWQPWLPQQNNTSGQPVINGGQNAPAQPFNFWTLPGYGSKPATPQNYQFLDPNYSAYSGMGLNLSSQQQTQTPTQPTQTHTTGNSQTESRENPLQNWWRNSGIGVGFYRSTGVIKDQIFDLTGGQLESHLVNQSRSVLKGNANFLEFNSSGMSSERYVATRMLNARNHSNFNFIPTELNTKLAKLDAGIDVLESNLASKFKLTGKVTNGIQSWQTAKLGAFNTKFPTLGKINSAPQEFLTNLAAKHPNAVGGTCTALKWGGRACFVASVAVEGYGVYKVATDPKVRQDYIDNNINGDPFTLSLNHEPSTGEVVAIKTCDAVGGLAGAWAGGEIGATLGSAVFPPIGTVVGGVLGGAIGYVIGSGLGKNIATGVANGCKWVGEKVTQAWDATCKGVKAGCKAIGDGCKAAGKWIGKQYDKAKTAVKQTYNKVKTAVTQKINQVKTAVKQKITQVKTAVKEKITQVKTAVKQKVTQVKTAVKSVAKKAVNTIKSGAKKVWNAIKFW